MLVLALTPTLSWSSLRQSSARAAAGFFFPTRCLACERREVVRFFRGGVCETCWAALPAGDPPRCARCDEALTRAGDDLCGVCLLDPPAFARLRAAAPYRGSARTILRAFKFRGADFLAERAAQRLCERLGVPERARRVVAAPARRATAGGYRPASLLAQGVAARLGLPFLTRGIEKSRPTERQSLLPWGRRAANVRGAFRAAPISEDVLLVDDVSTSTATARECARALRRAGAASIEVWCFARASRLDLPDDFGADPAPDGP